MMRTVFLMTAILLFGGCAERSGRGCSLRMSYLQTSACADGGIASGYVWARNDGVRMADHPLLLQQGQRHQAECRLNAGPGANLDQNAYSVCMRGHGYTPRVRQF